MNLILLGPPGCGKGTQGELIAGESGNYVVLSTGALFREEVERGTSLGRRVEMRMQGGQLIDDASTMCLVRAFLKRKGQKSVIFDGIPRTLAQVEALHSIVPVTTCLAFLFDVSEKLLFARMKGRAKRQKRFDDRVEVFERRLCVYAREAKEVIRWYEERRRLLKIDGEHSVEVVHEAVMSVLDNIVLAPVEFADPS